MRAREINVIAAAVLAVCDELPAPDTESALLVLLLNNGPQAVEWVRQRLAITHSGAVRAADRLATAGLVVRRVAPDDRRTVLLVLSAAGTARARAVQRARHDGVKRLVDRLPDDVRVIAVKACERVLAGSPRSRAAADRVCRGCDYEVCTP